MMLTMVLRNEAQRLPLRLMLSFVSSAPTRISMSAPGRKGALH